MDILFRQSGHHREATVVMRHDGVRLSVPVYGKLDPIPHDLAHYVIERELGLQDGFWASVAAGAIFGGMAILKGRQPPHARERSRALMKANHQGILFAEVVVDAVMRAVKGEPLGVDPLPVESPVVRSRSRAERDALIVRLLPAMQAMCAWWQAVPLGETLLLVWPDRPDQPARQGRLSRR
jgi:hypothetical protein